MSRKLLLLLPLGFAAAGLMVYLSLSAGLFSFKSYKELLFAQIEKAIGRKLEVGRIRLTFAGGVGLELGEVVLKGHRADEPVLRAKSIYAGLDIAPLLRKKVVLKKVAFDEPKLSLSLSAFTSAKLGEGGSGEDLARRLASAYKKLALFVAAKEVSVAGGELLIKGLLPEGEGGGKSNDSKIGYTGQAEDPRQGSIKISRIDLNAKNFQPGLKAEVSFSASITARGEGLSTAADESGPGGSILASDIRLQGQIEDIPEDGDLSKSTIRLKGSIKSFHPKPYSELFSALRRLRALEGLYDLRFQLALKGGDRIEGEIELAAQNLEADYPEYFASKLSARKVSLLIEGSYQAGGDLVGDAFRLEAEDLAIRGKFAIRNIASAGRYLDATLSIPRFSLKDHVRFIPLRKVPNNIASFLQERTLGGELDIIEARLTGELGDFAKKSAYKEKRLIAARVQFRDATVLLGDDFYIVSNASGKAIIDGPKAELSSLRGNYYNTKFFNGRGEAVDLYGEPLLKMWLDAKPDLEQLRADFASRKKYEEVSDFAEDLGGLTGKSSAKLFVVKKFKPHDPLLYEGELTLEGVGADHKAFDLRFTEMAGLLHFHNNFLSTKNLKGKLGPFAFEATGKYGDLSMKQVFLGPDVEDGTGLDLLFKKLLPFKSGFDFKVESKVDLGQLKELMPLKFLPKQIAYIVLGLDHLDGGAEAVMSFYRATTKGPVVGEVDFDVIATLNGASLRPRAVPEVFRAITGQIKFDRKDIKSLWLKGAARGSDLTLEGSIKDYGGSDPGLSMRLSASGDFVDIASLMGSAPDIAEGLSGDYLFNLVVAGALNDIKFDGLLDLSGAGYYLDRRIGKAAGTPNLIQFSGRSEGLNSIDIEKFIYALDSEAFFGNGSLSLGGRWRYSLTANWTGLSVAKWVRSFNYGRGYQVEGAFDGQLALIGNLREKALRKVELRAALKGLKVKRGDTAAEELLSMDGRLALVDGFLNINFLSAKVRDSLFEIRGSIPGFNGKVLEDTIAPLISLLGGSASGFTPIRARTSLPDVKFDGDGASSNLYAFAFPSDWNFEGKAALGIFSFRGLILKDVALQFALNEGVLEIKSFRSSFYGGNLELSGWISGAAELKEKAFLFNGQIRGADLQAMLADAYPGKEVMGGKLNLIASLKGLYTASGPVAKTIHGDFSLKLLKGHIKKYATLANILSLLNIAQLLDFKLPTIKAEGMPFNFITTDFKIEDGAASTDNFYFDSDAMKALMKGRIELDSWRCDLQVAVQPLLTVDRFVGSIPFVGRVLAGKEKRFVVSYFNVTGTILEPKVEPVPLKTVGEGVRGIFKRLIKMPEFIFLGRD